MTPFEIEAELRVRRDHLSEGAARSVALDRALQDGGRLRPAWLDHFANWWAAATAALRLGDIHDVRVTPPPRGCH